MNRIIPEMYVTLLQLIRDVFVVDEKYREIAATEFAQAKADLNSDGFLTSERILKKEYLGGRRAPHF